MRRDRTVTQEAVEIQTLIDIEGQTLAGNRVTHAAQRRQRHADGPDHQCAAQTWFQLHWLNFSQSGRYSLLVRAVAFRVDVEEGLELDEPGVRAGLPFVPAVDVALRRQQARPGDG